MGLDQLLVRKPQFAQLAVDVLYAGCQPVDSLLKFELRIALLQPPQQYTHFLGLLTPLSDAFLQIQQEGKYHYVSRVRKVAELKDSSITQMPRSSFLQYPKDAILSSEQEWARKDKP